MMSFFARASHTGNVGQTCTAPTRPMLPTRVMGTPFSDSCAVPRAGRVRDEHLAVGDRTLPLAEQLEHTLHPPLTGG